MLFGALNYSTFALDQRWLIVYLSCRAAGAMCSANGTRLDRILKTERQHKPSKFIHGARTQQISL